MSTTPQRSVLVVQPDAICTVGHVGTALADAGLEVRIVHPYVGEPVPVQLAEDGLVVLGGRSSALDDDERPWLADVRALIRAAHGAGKPALGICLGGQLTAQAFGGQVRVATGLEAGAVEIRTRAEAGDDAVVGALPASFWTGALHGDSITVLPHGAVWLAESEQYRHQAFRVGATTWGLQFHPEIGLDTYRTWSASTRESDLSLDPLLRAGDAAFVAHENEVLRTSRTVGGRFAALVAGS